MKATLTIDMGNAAFDGNNGRELARILTDAAVWAEREGVICPDEPPHGLRDFNGNLVGKMGFSL